MTTVDHADVRASLQDGTYPRPQLLRESWADLSGPWTFAFDDEDAGRAAGWHTSRGFDRTIQVPFPPESAASGIGDPTPRSVFWYQREVTADELAAAGHAPGRRLRLNFGAVDYRCEVWVDGTCVGGHVGGQTPFSFDVTDALADTATHSVVVRAYDDPRDAAQPRGKQDWQDEPHAIWYHRTSGIWQPVWLESVPPVAVGVLHWTVDVPRASVVARIVLGERPSGETPVEVELSFDGRRIARVATQTTEPELEVTLQLPDVVNGQGYHAMVWHPDRPRLVDAVVRVGDDVVASYLGLRTAGVEGGRFALNGEPYYLRSVLSQGYWPDSHLAAPSAEALRREVELIKELGFNAARLHQKYEDPRLLFWADRLGLLLWGEAPAALAFGPTAVERTIAEWLRVVERDYSHPSIVAWVPLNESWGVQYIRYDHRMVEFARAITALTRAVDATRPVVCNDGWEQVDTDVVAIHDYEWDGGVIAERYRDQVAIDHMLDTVGPAGRPLVLAGDVTGKPVMLTEFGGVSFDTSQRRDAWGYSVATSPEDFATRVGAILDGVRASRVLAGYCYTQLTDTLQETNGLLNADRTPKLPVEQLRGIITGR
ncbi:glycosyl hydrolase family 2 [Salana multivorans]|uniref:Glycosyl hydrolase family 2 n=1 Tax=Salana multivorans TaxID=120377 RepID=A0A3N2DAV8_9MICO|nr:glycoside hydrolase family 2 TIM barrel-domain containing protein [Salana multivorans]ROR96584.1 glycosyl hydrolase family 2 [Salana multivorans]